MVNILKASLTEEQLRFANHINLNITDNGLPLEVKQGEALKVEIKQEKIIIYYSIVPEIYRGLALLKDGLSVGDVVEQPRAFDTLSAFCDCSRNAVLKVETVKEYIMDIAALGYNQLYLYTEDTIEIPEYPYFGHLRGRYSTDEIKEIDAFAKEYGIELIPAVQTLAHLNAIFHWKQFDGVHDTDDIILCDDENSYLLLDKLFKSLREAYSTDKVNIGMDEAHMLGLGKYLEKNGYTSKMDIFLKHISRVNEIVHKYGFKPIMWSDMFFKIATGRCTYESLEAITFNDKVLDLIPKDMTLVYWNYSPKTEEYYDKLIEAHQMMKRKVVFAGGCRKWVGFSPNYQMSFSASRMALNSVTNRKIRDVIMTGWGDDGAEGSLYLTIPGLTLFAEKCYTDDMSDEAVDKKLRSLFGISLSEFFSLEKPNCPPGNKNDIHNIGANANKVILWNDPLLGQYDRHIISGCNDYYKKIAEELKPLLQRNSRLSYVFQTVYYLCDFLSTKAELGNKIRSAYKENNKEELKKQLDTISDAIEKLDAFHRVFRKNWQKENKIFGFDVQDIRFGTLRSRLVYSEELLTGYLNGDIKTIEELEVDLLYMDCREVDCEQALHFCCNNWKQIVTAGVL